MCRFRELFGSFSFQFHKGTIRTASSAPRVFLLLPFQFHKGTIRTKAFCAAFAANFDFNSIKVRLEPLQLSVHTITEFSFQFHKGTIRTSTQTTWVSCSLKFQFHKGTIRTSTCLFLKRFVLPLFQFHKGTIRTRVLARQWNQFIVFQFHKGTIRTHQSRLKISLNAISIP